MFESRYDRAAVVTGGMTAIVILCLITLEIVGNMQESRYSRYYNTSCFIVFVFSGINGAGVAWAVRELGRGWIPPIVYVTLASIVSLIYIGDEYSIRWYGEEGIVPFIYYSGTLVCSAAGLYVLATIIEWVGKGRA